MPLSVALGLVKNQLHSEPHDAARVPSVQVLSSPSHNQAGLSRGLDVWHNTSKSQRARRLNRLGPPELWHCKASPLKGSETIIKCHLLLFNGEVLERARPRDQLLVLMRRLQRWTNLLAINSSWLTVVDGAHQLFGTEITHLLGCDGKIFRRERLRAPSRCVHLVDKVPMVH